MGGHAVDAALHDDGGVKAQHLKATIDNLAVAFGSELQILEFFLEALKGLLTVQGIIYVVLGSLAGVILGAIPGLGSSTLIVVLLPISYKLNPAMTMALSYSASETLICV